MTKDSPRAIYSKFGKYVQNGNKEFIEQFTIEDLERTLAIYVRDKDWPPYKAMELRLFELKDKKNKKEKLKDMCLGAIITLLITGIFTGIYKLGAYYLNSR